MTMLTRKNRESRTTSRTMRNGRFFEPYLYLVPAIFLIVAFTYYPFFRTLIMSTFLVNASGVAVEYVAMENYQNVLGDDVFITSVLNTFKYAVIQVPCTIGIAFFLALAANKKRKTSRLYELMFSLPMAASMAVTALIFRLILNPNIGAFNYIFNTNILWFNDESTALLSIIFISVWMGIGMDFLFLLSAVRGVPEELIESSSMEGAGFWQKLWHIYLPMTSPTLFFVICTNMASAMMMAGQVVVLTKGGPNNSTSTIIYYMYKKAFEIYNYGYAYSAAVIGFVLAFVLIFINFMFEKKGVHYT